MILDNLVFIPSITKYFDKENLSVTENGIYYNKNSPIFDNIDINKINFVDDYFGEKKIHYFTNVKFRITSSYSEPFKWRYSPVSIGEDNKIINISNKTLSYFTILNYTSFDSTNINESYDILTNSQDFEIVEEEVFQFFDCFPFAPVHNLDDTYNLLFSYKKNNLRGKLLVLESDNFFYNQCLSSLKKYFDLEYFYIKPSHNYFFKNYTCVRQYHWIQIDALEFIQKNYISKICEDYSGIQFYESLSIIKYEDQKNCSTLDIFEASEKFNNFQKEKNIFDLNSIVDNFEYKIYLINKSKFILSSFLSPFNVNIYKHCLETDKKFFFIFSDGKRNYDDVINNHFRIIKSNVKYNEYDFYGTLYNGIVEDGVTNLESLIPKIDDLLKLNES